jgi:hypothetical protein
MTLQLAMPEPTDAADRQGDDSAYYRRVLHEFIEMGAEVARLFVQDAKSVVEPKQPHDGTGAVPGAGAGPAIAIAFDRVARTVRRSIMLARQLDEPVPAAAAESRRWAARTRVIRAVEDAARREPETDGAEGLDGERRERPELPEQGDDIGGQSIDEIFAAICRDLGLAALPGGIDGHGGGWPLSGTPPPGAAAGVAAPSSLARAGVPRPDSSPPRSAWVGGPWQAAANQPPWVPPDG